MKKAPICWYPKPADRCFFPAINFLVQKKGALFVFIFQKGHLAFSESVLVQIPTVPEKTVSRSFVFRLKPGSEKPRKRPIGCAFTRIRSKLTIIDGGGGGNRTRVRKPIPMAFYEHSRKFTFPRRTVERRTARLSSFQYNHGAEALPMIVHH